MKKSVIKFTKTRKVQLPYRAHSQDAGIDFYVPKFDKLFLEALEEKNKDLFIKPSQSMGIVSQSNTLILSGESSNNRIVSDFNLFDENAEIIKTNTTFEVKNYRSGFNYLESVVEVNIFWADRKAGMGLLSSIDYKIIEKQNASVWIVQAGIFNRCEGEMSVCGGGGSFHGCLEFIDAESGEILAQGFYGYG